MISRILLEDVLAAAMSTGADFAEVYAEKTRNKTQTCRTFISHKQT